VQTECRQRDPHEDKEPILRDRFECFVEAGVSWADAVQLALRQEIETPTVLSLIGQGCPPATAASILL
jgi:hypothetical protein